MKWQTLWQTIWLLAKDIALTGTGLTIILTQAFAARPSDLLLVTAVALTTPSLASHAITLLSGPSAGKPGPSPSSSSSSPHGPPPASSAPDPGEGSS